MLRKSITLPQLGLIAGTRGMLDAGIALLLADRLEPGQRRAVGWTLAAVGALTTIPLAAEVLLGSGSENNKSREMSEIPEEAADLVKSP